jgi:hypothetical protein
MKKVAAGHKDEFKQARENGAVLFFDEARGRGVRGVAFA